MVDSGLKIKQFRYSADNLSYLIYGENDSIAIDGGAVDDILKFVSEHGLSLKYVTNTHSHHDHLIGTKELVRKSGAEFIENATKKKQKIIKLDRNEIEVIHTPGHTPDSIVFSFGNILITGDTIFNGTIGNCFPGDLKGFYNSIKYLTNYPGDTIIYAGHDYVEDAMRKSGILEPENSNISPYLEKYDPEHVFSTLNDEFKVNRYLRFNKTPMIEILKDRGLPIGSEYDRWESIMSIEIV